MAAQLHFQCKLCNLLKQNQDLWVEVHNQILTEKISRTVVVKWLNTQILTHNNKSDKKNKLPIFNNANFSNHFSKHISTAAKMKSELRNTLSTGVERGSTAFDKKQQTVADSVSSEIPDDSGKLVIVDMVELIENKLRAYSKQVKEQDVKNAGKRLNIRDIEDIQKLTTELVSLKQNIIKLQSSEHVTKLAVRSAVETAVGNFIENLIKATDEANTLLVQSLPDSSVPAQVIALIRGRVGENMKFVIPEIINQIYKNFNIK